MSVLRRSADPAAVARGLVPRKRVAERATSPRATDLEQGAGASERASGAKRVALKTASAAGVAGVWATRLALVALAVGAVWTRVQALHVDDELNADEALPGLMALHIAAGRETPVFYYGQHYFGAVEAYLVAALDRFAGFHDWFIYVPPIVASTL